MGERAEFRRAWSGIMEDDETGVGGMYAAGSRSWLDGMVTDKMRALIARRPRQV